jgi:hypothetical protein
MKRWSASGRSWRSSADISGLLRPYRSSPDFSRHPRTYAYSRVGEFSSYAPFFPPKLRGEVLSHREDILASLRAHLLAEDPSLTPEALPEDASLTATLGLDSGRLASLFAMVRARISDRDLTPWLIQASRHGQDTLEGLAEFLAHAPIPPPHAGTE